MLTQASPGEESMFWCFAGRTTSGAAKCCWMQVAVGPLALRQDADVRPALAPTAAALAASAVDSVTSTVAGAAARGCNPEDIELDGI